MAREYSSSPVEQPALQNAETGPSLNGERILILTFGLCLGLFLSQNFGQKLFLSVTETDSYLEKK